MWLLFAELQNRSQFWLDTVYEPLLSILPEMLESPEMILDLDEQISVAKLFANVIDFRSPITANHSRRCRGKRGASRAAYEFFPYGMSDDAYSGISA